MVNISWARSAIMTGALSVARARREGCMSFGTSTSDPIACALHVPTVLHLVYVSAVDTIPWRSGASPLCVCCGHCTLEKRLLKTLYTGEEALLEKRPLVL